MLAFGKNNKLIRDERNNLQERYVLKNSLTLHEKNIGINVTVTGNRVFHYYFRYLEDVHP